MVQVLDSKSSSTLIEEIQKDLFEIDPEITNISLEESFARYRIDERVEQYFEVQLEADRIRNYYANISKKTMGKRLRYWFMFKEELYPKNFECTGDEFIDALDRAIKEKKRITECGIKRRVSRK